MNILHDLVKDTPLPRLVKIHQKFDTLEIADVPQALQTEFTRPGVGERIKPGMKIAIAVGSRGMTDIPTLARVVAEEVKKRGGEPFIVPAMGSHGGATAEGQKLILTHLGVTEETAGCPIISSMEVVEVGRLPNGLAVLIDKNAYEADGIIVINRVKPHTCYRGPCESGMAKMIAIGLGKQKGADSCHAYGFKHMASFVVEMAKIKIARTSILFGIGTVENAYDKIARIVAVPAEDLVKTDSEMLVEAKARMPRFLIDKIDVLVVDQIGKDCSGDGMDPNITGRFPTPYATGGPGIAKLVVLDLTAATHGNASGVGAADITTRKLFSKIDFQSTYANVITSTVFRGTSIPPMFDTDEDAVKAAVKTCNAPDISKTRMIVIQDTMHMGDIYISESLLAEAKANPDIEILSGPMDMPFDSDGNFRLFSQAGK